ncbi:type IV pilin protein [Marinobacter xestospongiae]|uniref:type IV pilin protein n=1 Tax=Marinobacter xestospongiae TaxID=994319 RepID=UPI00249E272D|nr:type IV pilin protein [Marinobacter xestospongiae]
MSVRVMNQSKGFTLIEALIVLAIIGIIAAVAYPAYQKQIQSSRRAEAQSALLGLTAAMEKHFTANNSYLGAAAGGSNTGRPGVYYDKVPKDGGQAYYTLRIVAATPTTFRVQATPVNSQVGDGFLDVNHQGLRRWDKNDNGNAGEAGEDNWQKD